MKYKKRIAEYTQEDWKNTIKNRNFLPPLNVITDDMIPTILKSKEICQKINERLILSNEEYKELKEKIKKIIDCNNMDDAHIFTNDKIGKYEIKNIIAENPYAYILLPDEVKVEFFPDFIKHFDEINESIILSDEIVSDLNCCKEIVQYNNDRKDTYLVDLIIFKNYEQVQMLFKTFKSNEIFIKEIHELFISTSSDDEIRMKLIKDYIDEYGLNHFLKVFKNEKYNCTKGTIIKYEKDIIKWMTKDISFINIFSENGFRNNWYICEILARNTELLKKYIAHDEHKFNLDAAYIELEKLTENEIIQISSYTKNLLVQLPDKLKRNETFMHKFFVKYLKKQEKEEYSYSNEELEWIYYFIRYVPQNKEFIKTLLENKWIAIAKEIIPDEMLEDEEIKELMKKYECNIEKEIDFEAMKGLEYIRNVSA